MNVRIDPELYYQAVMQDAVWITLILLGSLLFGVIFAAILNYLDNRKKPLRIPRGKVKDFTEK